MGPKWTQAEGFILGVGAKMFTIAGPVIVYGVSASVVYGGALLDNRLVIMQKARRMASPLLIQNRRVLQTFYPARYR